MFGIGGSELLIIVLAIVIFINPKDFPAFARKLGRLWGQIKSVNSKIKSAVEEGKDEGEER
jgi:Sec-independent protein translocase protein TatA